MIRETAMRLLLFHPTPEQTVGHSMDQSDYFQPAARAAERPIVLSPPPVALKEYTAERQQSVGYNLQQEFEALKADLDLDLREDKAHATPQNLQNLQSSSGGISLASLQNTLPRGGVFDSFREQTLSPTLLKPFRMLQPSRPLSVNDFLRPLGFYAEAARYTLWMEGLVPQEMMSLLDHWCAHLPFDILLAMKLRLEAHVAQVYPVDPYKGKMFKEEDKEEVRLFDPRPKLAEPAVHLEWFDEEERGPASQLYEKTSFLQLAAGLAYPVAPPEDFELAQLKLGALHTINLRVALDARKPHARQLEELINRARNSLLVPAMAQKYSLVALGAKKAAALLMPAEIASADLLANIPAWLKVLRLHKYTDCLKDVPWRELVLLLDEQLEAKGVKALGARRKLLKAFEAVRAAHPA